MSEQLKTRIMAALRTLAEDRGATIDVVSAQPDLMTLGCVVAEASDHGRVEPDLDVVAGVAILLLEEAANSLEQHPQVSTVPNRAAAARVALGVQFGSQGKPLRGRRGTGGRVGTIASWLGYEAASLFKPRQDGRSPFDALLEDVAEYVVRREVAHLVGEQRLAQRARRPPLESAMHVDWLARFERYYTIWSPVSGLHFDIEMAVVKQREGNVAELDYFARKSLWYYACFVTDLRTFVRERGGLWIMPDPKAEQVIADAMWYVQKSTPMTELDDSLLRLAVTGFKELAIFINATYTDTAMRRLTETWRTWIASCACRNLKRPRKDCPVHECTTWAIAFTDNVDKQWDLLADWYDVPRPPSIVPRATLTRQPLPPPQTS
jgi:hypothetical protein